MRGGFFLKNKIMKVKKQFFCIQEKKTYKVGDEYTGERKDLSHFLEMEDKNAAPKKKVATKAKKAPKKK